MKSAYSDVTLWLRCMAVVSWTETQLASRVIAVSFAGGDENPEVREDLSACVYLLSREHDELLARAAEQFGKTKEPDEAAPILRAFARYEGSPPASVVGSLRGSVAARVRLFRNKRERFDAHTRLVLGIHATLAEHMILPILQRLATRLGQASTEEDVFEPLYDAVMPAARAHGDDFLAAPGADGRR
jgi:hypothetical protein